MVIQLSQTYWNDGVQTLADHLQYENNITLDPSTIYRILKRNNVRYTQYYRRTQKRWKKQLYTHTVPGRELQMDTKYPFGYKQGRVMYTIIDDASRWVYAYTYTTATKENTLDFIKRVQQNAPFPIQKIRTDQGKEFNNYLVIQYLAAQEIAHRLNTPYCPEENGKIERFHRTLNEKCIISMYTSDNLELLQYKLTLFLQYYNYQKRHRGLGMDGMTPMQKLKASGSYAAWG